MKTACTFLGRHFRLSRASPARFRRNRLISRQIKNRAKWHFSFATSGKIEVVRRREESLRIDAQALLL
jgi:hypothetical protein